MVTGDQVLGTRIQAEAAWYICGYDVDLDVLET